VNEIAIPNFAAWRTHARALLKAGTSPESVHFVDAHLGQSSLDILVDSTPPAAGSAGAVPREFLELAAAAGCFRDGERWNLLYRVLWRLTHGEKHLLSDHVDNDVRRLRMMEKSVRRDMHKMRAFVRFREVHTEDGPEYIAWHRPDHWIVEANAPFFVRRFGSMRWAILTPDESAYWDGEELCFGPGVPRSAAPADDQLEDLWRTYYGSIFNPARANLRAMRAEMPVRHWATMPETEIINDLLRNAGSRTISMVKDQPQSARPFIPEHPSLPVMAKAVQHCEGCDLYKIATQAVFGEGPKQAPVVLVGEQPGDQEDLSGRPFVGPAGQLLDKALKDAGVDRDSVYVTNAVKHFSYEERGKRRLHKKPTGPQVSACRPWLEAELGVIKPDVVVCLGATAAQSLAGRDVRIQKDRGKFLETRWAKQLLVTTHPSALLRLPDRSQFDEQYSLLVNDLALVAQFVHRKPT
jgi:probable DNA metabolism protein